MIAIENSDAFVPTNDYVFKRIFGHVGNETITKGLLNSILDTKVKTIDLDKNTITEKDLYDDKIGILDIKATLNNDISCDIEMQVVSQDDIEKRILFYWSKLYISNIKSGQDYENLRKSIVILFSNENLKSLKEISEGHTEWKLREKKFPKIVLTNVCEVHIIEIEKIVELMKSKQKSIKEKKLQSWVKFLLTPNELGAIDMEDNEALKKAKEEYDSIAQDEHERYLAELRMKHVLDSKAIRRYGYKEGKEEGIKEGEKVTTIQIAKEMLKKGIDIQTILDCTKLTKEEIEKIQKDT